MKKSSKLKVYVTCPIDHVEKLRIAIGNAGGGKMGNYSHCSFITMIGKGHFCPIDGANPSIGKIGKHEIVNEAKIEFVCDKSIIKEVIKVIEEVHPYEEIGYDIIELLEI